jgi:hypothetical protein
VQVIDSDKHSRLLQYRIQSFKEQALIVPASFKNRMTFPLETFAKNSFFIHYKNRKKATEGQGGMYYMYVLAAVINFIGPFYPWPDRGTVVERFTIDLQFKSSNPASAWHQGLC